MGLFVDTDRFIFVDPYVDAVLPTTGWALNFLLGSNEAGMGLRKDMRDAILKLLQYEDGSLVWPDGIDNVPAPPPNLKHTLDEVYAGMTPEEKAAKEAALSQPLTAEQRAQQGQAATPVMLKPQTKYHEEEEDEAEGEAPPVQQSSSFSAVNPNVSRLNSMANFNPVIGTPKTSADIEAEAEGRPIMGNLNPRPIEETEGLTDWSPPSDGRYDVPVLKEEHDQNMNIFNKKPYRGLRGPKTSKKSIAGPPTTSKSYGGLRPRSGGGGLSGNRIV